MNRDWLKEQIPTYLHDASVDGQLDTWIDIAAYRLSQVLKCREMEATLTKVTGEEYITLASDQQVLDSRYLTDVQWLNESGAYVNLRSVPAHDAGRYKRDGRPSVYHLEDSKIYPLPYQEGEYRALCLVQLVVPDGTTSTAALLAYPHLFLYAALNEAYDWKQDPEMSARYQTKWLEDAQRITRIYESERVGDAPAMRAV